MEVVSGFEGGYGMDDRGCETDDDARTSGGHARQYSAMKSPSLRIIIADFWWSYHPCLDLRGTSLLSPFDIIELRSFTLFTPEFILLCVKGYGGVLK